LILLPLLLLSLFSFSADYCHLPAVLPTPSFSFFFFFLLNMARREAARVVTPREPVPRARRRYQPMV
jgi:hypothetical protein